VSSEPRAKAWQVGATPLAALTASLGALLCCALPSFLVFVGLGATVASVVASAPWLVAASRYNGWVFAGAALVIGFTWMYLHRLAPRPGSAGSACPLWLVRLSRTVWRLSLALYAVGFFVAFGLGPLLEMLEP